MKGAIRSLALIAAAAVATIAAYGLDRYRDDFTEVEKEVIRRTFDFSKPSDMRSVDVDNIEGSIEVTGYDGASVQLEIVKTISARSKDDAELAKQQVELKVSEKSNRLDAYVDGPFRCKDERRSRRVFYRVNYDFQIKVPRDCSLGLRTVNNGNIRVDGVAGKFDIENVNGSIIMNEIAGSGRAHTVNGGVTVTFSRNPAGDWSFGSINGNLDVAFRHDLSADCWFKTFNGGAYTDFEIHSLPQPAVETERRNGKFVYTSRFFGTRIGKGGPEIKFDTFNGDIHLTSR